MASIAVRARGLVLVLTVAFGVSACSDYSIRLPNDYELIRIYAGAVLIGAPEGGARVEANIDGYTVIGELVVGHVTAAEHSPEKEMSKPGYFILNTESHEVKQGLSKEDWFDAIKGLGITREPSLGKPSRFDNHYRKP